jgi:hypothetical protein
MLNRKNFFLNFSVEIQEENVDFFAKVVAESSKDIYSYMKEIIALNDASNTFQVLFVLYLLSKITNCLGDRFIVFILLNVALFYSPLDKNFPNFLFKIFIICKQCIEGIIGVIICIVPKYEEVVDEKEKKA